ncbi:DNA-binding protein WhiA [Oceanotoga teriensis]|uniref:DNA-binding protein WhiA n=1 Tax=Oceanotoga teriensis TaxID=515440 RepID=UPI0027143743|nr:DNA-binding protein WhiA [Oceanotoga teriensis]MDO7976106.1 DNA-binding protein WhiA [Oceanotoga teriensis]
MATFSEEVKMSLVNTSFLYPEIELFGAIKGKGDFVLDGHKKFIKITVSSISSMKRVYKLCKQLFGEFISAYVKIERRLNLGRTREILLDLNFVDKVLSSQGINLYKDTLPKVLKEDPVKFGVFLKGMFLTTGSISLKSSYHMEFYLDISEEFVKDLIDNFKILLGVKSNYIHKNNKIKFYIKSSGDILNILEAMDAQESSKKLLDIMRIRGIKGNVSRTINFLSANASKTAESSSKQIDDINYICSTIGIDSLDDNLKKIALYRLENTEDSLKEMAEALNMKKSTLYSRIKKIKGISKQLQDEQNLEEEGEKK